jgi:hypothetical protein
VGSVAVKLFMTGRYSLESICVFGENCDESAAFLNPILRGRRYQEFYQEYEKLETDTERERSLSRFVKWLHLDPNCTTLYDAADACPFYDRDTPTGTRALQEYFAH